MLYRVLTSDHIDWADIVMLVIRYFDQIGFFLFMTFVLGWYVFDKLKSKKIQNSDLNNK